MAAQAGTATLTGIISACLHLLGRAHPLLYSFLAILYFILLLPFRAELVGLFAVLALALVPLVLLMKRSVAEPGEHVGAE